MKFLKRKKIYISIFIVLLFGIIFYFIYVNKSNDVNAIEEVEEDIIEKEVVEEVNNKIKVDIKGMVNNPGVYELDEGSRVIDQTTPNMIQRISGIFERKPLISKGI